MRHFASKIDTIYKDFTSENKQDQNDPIKNYIENLINQLNKDANTHSSETNKDDKRQNNKRKQ